MKVDWSHFWGNFDKFVLVFLVLYFSLIGWHAVFHIDTSNIYVQNFMSAMLDNQKLVIGALLGLITGKALQSKVNGNAPAAPPATPQAPGAPSNGAV
jgi:hypothetical protein